MGFEIRKKEKHVKAKDFVKKMKKVHEEAKVALKKLQEEMKKYADKDRKGVVEYKVEDRILLSIKDLMWQTRNRETKKLIERFIGLYKIKKIISENMVKLELLAPMKIHLVVNVSRIAIYQEQIERQKEILSPIRELDFLRLFSSVYFG